MGQSAGRQSQAVGPPGITPISWEIGAWPDRSALTAAVGVRAVRGLAATLAGVVLLVIRHRAVVTWPTVVWLIVFAVVGVYAVRGIAWWALAAVPPVALLVAGTARAPVRERPGTPTMRRANALIAGLLILVAVALLPLWRSTEVGTGTPAGLLSDAPSGDPSPCAGK